MPTLLSGMAPVSQSWSKYTKIIREKVSHSPVYVSHSYHLGVALVGNATPKRGFSDKNASFLWCLSKINNFRFFIIRSCFYSWVVSLFGPSELPGNPGQMNSPSTPSCTIDITQHALKGQKLLAQGNALGIMAISNAPCKGKSFKIHIIKKDNPLRYVKLLPLQGAWFATHKNPGRCPGLRASALSGRAAYMSFLAFRACCLYWLLGLRGVLLI